jgi:hypothetical protein
MADARAGAAHPAAATLAATGEQTVRWLRGRLAPAAALDAKRIGQLIAELGHERFAVREKAMRDLEGLGEPAAAALREALKGSLPLEVKRRAEQIIGKINRRVPEELRTLRAVDVLEQIGTAEAREILRTLAGGAAEARLTQEARASLRRLERPSGSP